MVQRKAPNKIGLQANHLPKSEKILSNLKPICFQQQDGKKRGSDMKKKMKKSKPINLTDFGGLSSPPLKKTIPQHGKLPPLCSPATSAAPQKQALVKPGDGSPNYMKATTSSEARKERRRKSSRLCKKPAKSLTKSSSLKMVRTLTKSPNFKPVRSAGKKSSRVALCADVDVQKATCSSTLKDSKFPPYLILNPGGTESEGTSVLKVCPYSYCSLNGHHHAPSPPLKCFLKAKRRSMKTQKSSKLQTSSSPRRVKPSTDKTEEISAELGMDLFVEIYAKKVADDAEETRERTENNVDNEAEAEEENKDQVFENLSDASPQSEIDLEENYVNGFLSFLAEEARAGSCNNESDIEGENVSDMEWEEAQFSNSENWEEENKCCSTDVYPSEEIKQLDDEPEIFVSDGVSSYTEEILADDVFQELFHEESASCTLQCHESDSEMQDVVQNWGIFEEKSEESEQDSGDSTSAAPSMEESVVALEIADDNVEGDGEYVVESNEIIMNPEVKNAEAWDSNQDDKSLQFGDETEANQSSGLEELQSGAAEDPVEEQLQVPTQELDNAINSVKSFDHQPWDSNQEDKSLQYGDETEAGQSSGLEELQSGKAEGPAEEKLQVPNQELENEINSVKTFDHQPENQLESTNKAKILTSEDSKEQNNSRICKMSSIGNESGDENMEVEVQIKSDAQQNSHTAENGSSAGSGSRYQRRINSSCELAEACSNRKWTINCRKSVIDVEKERDFNPREPNFLPIVPDPEAEKIDLKHQDMDDRKNAEEWMLDYALQQTVTRLAPARKRKVALLVEAFEKVLPIPKYDSHRTSNTASAFSPRPIQACS